MGWRIHRGLFVDTLRRLRTTALALTALTGLLMLCSALFGYPVAPMRYVPFVTAPLLTVAALRYQTSSVGSDFYFSLPLSRRALLLTDLTAVAVWLAGIVAVSTAINATAASAAVGDAVLDGTATWLSSLFVAAVTALASVLCGSTLNTVLTAAMLLLAPRLIAYTAVSAITAASPFLTPDSATVLLDAVSQNLLYGGREMPSVWVVTALKFLLVTGLALWSAPHRPAEFAGRPTVHPALHVVLRLLFGVLCLLPALTFLVPYRSYTLTEGLLCVLLGVAAYYLYELVLTRSAKGLWHATKWLPLLAVAALALVFGCSGAAAFANGAELTADRVDSVSVTRIVHRESDWAFERGYGYERETSYQGFTTDTFYNLTRRYAEESDAPQVRLADARSVETACDALARQNGRVPHVYESSEAPTMVFLADIAYHQGWFTHTRRVELTNVELRRLLSQVKKQTALPSGFDLIFDNNVACPFDFESYYQDDLDGDGYVEGDYAFPPAVY